MWSGACAKLLVLSPVCCVQRAFGCLTLEMFKLEPKALLLLNFVTNQLEHFLHPHFTLPPTTAFEKIIKMSVIMMKTVIVWVLELDEKVQGVGFSLILLPIPLFVSRLVLPYSYSNNLHL